MVSAPVPCRVVAEVGVAVVVRGDQGAVAGANEPSVPQRCDTAITTAEAVYGGALDDAHCTPGSTLTLTLSDTVPAVSPFGPWTVNVTAKAVSP